MDKKDLLVWSSAIAICGTSIFSAAAASAQDGGANTSASGVAADDEVILVTAQRREQRLQDVPVAVSVVGGESLSEQNLSELSDVSQRLPNVKISSGTISNNIVIRGIGSGPNPGFEQSVATFVDGVYRSRSRATRAALFDLQRVEVLKGPQLTFFGANAIAGALNIVTRKPGLNADVNGVMNFVPRTNGYDFQLGADIPLSDSLALRVAGRAAGSDGYIYNSRLDEFGPGDRTYQGRVTAVFEPSADFSSTLRIDGMTQRSDNAASFQAVGCPPGDGFTMAPVNTCRRAIALTGAVEDDLDYTTATGASSGAYEFVEAAWTNSLAMGNGSINAITGYFWHENETLGQAIPFPINAVVGQDGFPTSQNENYQQVSQEIRYQSDTGGTLEYMFGGYAARGDLTLNTIVGFRFNPFGRNDTSGNFNAATPLAGFNVIEQTDETLSAFGSATLRPVDAVRVNLGLRYSRIHKEASRVAAPGISATPNPRDGFVAQTPELSAIIAAILNTKTANFVDPTRTDDRLMPSIGVQYDIGPEAMIYANFASGFKAGGYSFGANNEEFGPETVNSYEIGLKGSFFDRLLTLEVAAYRSDYTDLQETSLQLQTNGSISSVVTNVGASRSQGVEVNGGLRLADWLRLSTGVAYLDAVYEDYPNGACTIAALAQGPGCVQDLTGARRAYAPEWSGNVGANITVPIGDYELSIDPLYYFSSRYFLSATADPLLEQEGFGKVDLRLGFGPQDGGWEIALVGKNLTDRTTMSFVQAVPLAPGTTSALVEAPRTIGVQVTFR